jgi:hypothetical protein
VSPAKLRLKPALITLGAVTAATIGILGYAGYDRPAHAPEHVPTPLFEPPPALIERMPTIQDALDAVRKRCTEWRDGARPEWITPAEVSRAFQACDALLPGERMSVSVPGSGIAVTLDVRSAAIGAGFGALVLLALRGLVAMVTGSRAHPTPPPRIVEPVWSGYLDRR